MVGGGGKINLLLFSFHRTEIPDATIAKSANQWLKKITTDPTNEIQNIYFLTFISFYYMTNYTINLVPSVWQHTGYI